MAEDADEPDPRDPWTPPPGAAPTAVAAVPAAASAAPADAVDAAESEALVSRPPSFLRNVLRDVSLTGILFLPVARRWLGVERYSGDARVIVLLLPLWLGGSVLAGYLAAAAQFPPAHLDFNVWAVYAAVNGLAFGAVLLFLIAAASARLHRLAPLLTGLLGVSLVGSVLLALSAVVGLSSSEVAAYVLLGWQVLAVMRVVFAELDFAGRPLAALAAGAGFAVGGVALPDAREAPYFDQEHRYAPLDVERTFVAQGVRVSAALDALSPSTPGVEETYFVGFASYSAQNVFENEVRHVQALFEDRFDASERSVLLVNSQDAVGELPIANAHNLGQVLAGVAAMMDDEDELFLHLTSHGSADHSLSVYFDNLGLHDITAQQLGEIVSVVDGPWRIIVVAACYAGGFIDAVKSPRTLVIAAARSDRQSFGCRHGREYTYFGEAFYRDSLVDRNYHSAFRNAREVVARREQNEGLRPSEPQIWAGEEMARRLGIEPEQTVLP